MAIGEWIIQHPHRWSDSRSQISNCIEDRLVELVRPLPLQPPVEYFTYTPTIPPEVNVIFIVGHHVLE
jgi:hypothetical protein